MRPPLQALERTIGRRLAAARKAVRHKSAVPDRTQFTRGEIAALEIVLADLADLKADHRKGSH